MTVSTDRPAASQDQPASEDSPSTGPGGPGTGEQKPTGWFRRPRGRRVLALVAAFSIAAGGSVGTAEAMSGPAVLTTAQIAARTDPGLVDVVSTLGYTGGAAAGTGMVLTSNGEVLTNNHVVEGATSIKVTDVGNGRTYSATVVGYDEQDDVAVLQLQGASGLATVTVGNSSTVHTGDTVVGIGNAGGQGGTPSAAAGTVTGLGQSITAGDQASGSTEQLTGLIGTNAGIQPGDSGGPLVNTYGQVVGMDTAGSATSSGVRFQSAQTTTQAFAIPVNEAVSIARQIEAGQSSSTVHVGATAFLGVELPSTGAGYPGGLPGGTSAGVTIAGVQPGSPAAGAGLQAGDAITSIGGHSVSSSADIQHVLEGYHPGQKVSVAWLDQYGQSHTATVTLAAGPVG